jgi:ATP-dependent Clp endopeptidase proteolytic subunit ClpP
MSIRNLPLASVPGRPKNFQWDAPSDVLARWAELPNADAGSDPATIAIYDVIGEDWWSGGGFTLQKASDALRAVGQQDVVVNINSPGGDMFEGIAIYNLLAQHKAKVTVNVMGIAASAASIIAMAGDVITMGTGSQIMIHNAWGVVVGNSNDMRLAADTFDGFNASLAEIYNARTGMKVAEIAALMDAETYLGTDQAIQLGFADSLLADAPAGTKAANHIDRALMARRQTEAALAKAGHSRSERQTMIAALGSPRDAGTTPPAARDAGEIAGLRALIQTLRS